MHIQNLDKFYKKRSEDIEQKRKIMTDERTNKRIDKQNNRQPKSYIAPLPFFQSGAIIKSPSTSLTTSSQCHQMSFKYMPLDVATRYCNRLQT